MAKQGEDNLKREKKILKIEEKVKEKKISDF